MNSGFLAAPEESSAGVRDRHAVSPGKRNRLLYGITACVVIVLGLASRRYAPVLPAFLARYLGDTLWALMVFMALGFLAPRWSPSRMAGVALAISFMVELSQLYHAPWIDALRHTRLGGLVLGHGFLGSDLLCYTAGVALGLVLDAAIFRAAAWRRGVAATA